MVGDVNFPTVQIRSRDVPQVKKFTVVKFHSEHFACVTHVKLQCDELASLKILFVIHELFFETIHLR